MYDLSEFLKTSMLVKYMYEYMCLCVVVGQATLKVDFRYLNDLIEREEVFMLLEIIIFLKLMFE